MLLVNHNMSEMPWTVSCSDRLCAALKLPQEGGTENLSLQKYHVFYDKQILFMQHHEEYSYFINT